MTWSNPISAADNQEQEREPSEADLLVKSLAVVAVLFGLLTVSSGGRTLFSGEAAHLAAGAIVPLLLWFNFVAGFAYVAWVLGLGSLAQPAERSGVATDQPACLKSQSGARRRSTLGRWRGRSVSSETSLANARRTPCASLRPPAAPGPRTSAPPSGRVGAPASEKCEGSTDVHCPAE